MSCLSSIYSYFQCNMQRKYSFPREIVRLQGFDETYEAF